MPIGAPGGIGPPGPIGPKPAAQAAANPTSTGNVDGGVTYNRVTSYQSVYRSPIALLLAAAVVTAPFHQTDWSVARAAARPNVGFTSQSLALASVPVVTKFDWPNPVLPIVRRQDWSHQTLLVRTVGAPGRQLDWPNPTLAAKPVVKDWFNNFPVPITVGAPFRQADWPTPRGAKSNPSFVQGALALQAVVVVSLPPRQSDWPNPTLRKLLPQSHENHYSVFDVTRPANEWVNPQVRTVARQDWVRPSNVALLTFVAGDPRRQTDWPNPRGVKSNPDFIQGTPKTLYADVVVGTPTAPVIDGGALFTKAVSYQSVYRSPVALLTATPVAPPFHQTDWPVPKGPKAVQDWTQQTLLVRTVGAPGRQSDWPNPVLSVVRRADWVTGTPQAATFVPTAVNTKNQYDWPNPRGSRQSTIDWVAGTSLLLKTAAVFALNAVAEVDGPSYGKDQTYVRSTALGSFRGLLTAVASPFRQTDWQNPTRSIERRADWVTGGNLPLTTIELSAAAEGSWPSFARDRSYLRSTAFGSPRLLLPVPVIVVVDTKSQYDWPNPRGPRRPTADWIAGTGLPLSTAPVVTYTLSATAEISGPDFRPDQTYLRSTKLGSPLGLITVAVANPFSQSDWPNPRGFKPLVQDWQHQTLLVRTVGAPFAQRDWPLPTPLIVRRQDWSQSSLALSVGAPRRQSDWPNPTLPTVRRQDWSQQTLLVRTVGFPFAQRDWPVPKDAKPKVSDWQYFNLVLSSFVQPPFKITDWPNPLPKPKLRIQFEFPAYQNFWPPTPIPVPPVIVLPRAKSIKTIVSGPQGRSQITGPGGKVQLASAKGQTQVTGGKGKTRVSGPKGRTDASDP